MIERAYHIATKSVNVDEFAYYESSWTQINKKNITIQVSPCIDEIAQGWLDQLQPFFERLNKGEKILISAKRLFDHEGQINEPKEQNTKVRHANIIMHVPFKLPESGQWMRVDLQCMNDVLQEISLLVRKIFPCINTEKSTVLIIQPNGKVFNVINRLKNPNKGNLAVNIVNLS